MNLAVLVLVLSAVTLQTGCANRSTAGEASPRPAPSPSQTRTPSELSCPSDEIFSAAGGLYAELPNGLDSRKQAIQQWLDQTDVVPKAQDFVIAEDGESAWILRANKTASAHVTFLIHDGFTVDGYQACIR